MKQKTKNILDHMRGTEWLLVAGLIALGIALLLGGTLYLTAWLGTLGKAATGAWGGLAIGRYTLRINSDDVDDDKAKAIMHLGRCILVGAAMVAVCLAV